MELKRRPSPRRPLAAAAAVLLGLGLIIPGAAAGVPSRVQVGLGYSIFLPGDPVLRDVYGGSLPAWQVRASVRFAGGWSLFAGYRRLDADGTALDLGTPFESAAYAVRLRLTSIRAGFAYGYRLGRWTFGGEAGLARLVCRETWSGTAMAAEETAIGAILAASADLSVLGPLGLFVRLEIGPTQRKADILLGGFDAAGGLSLRF